MLYGKTEENLVTIIPALGDNYIYLCSCGGNDVFAVDPGQASCVLETLAKQHLNLAAILATHHHYDHTAGIEELASKTGCIVIAANKGGSIDIGNLNVQTILTPGHTNDSACYYVQPSKSHDGLLFTGDTLFIGGCGRIIEGDASSLRHSLEILAALPDDTFVYPGHDYTEENYEFAITTAPGISELNERLEEIRHAKKHGFSLVPSTILQEKTTNIFLLSSEPQIKSALNMSNATDLEVFAELRRRKNIFG
jgi:hydroxyacylglutathione hydrolase